MRRLERWVAVFHRFKASEHLAAGKWNEQAVPVFLDA